MSAYVAYCLRRISERQRAELVLHVPGPRINYVRAGGTLVRKSLLKMGLLRRCDAHGRAWSRRGNSTHFTLTEAGREISAGILALEAERLVALEFACPIP